MVLIETLFDLLSATAGAMIGALFAFFLNHKRQKQMTRQMVVSRQSLEKIKLENENLLKQIQAKENLILQLQLQILGGNKDATKKTNASSTKGTSKKKK